MNIDEWLHQPVVATTCFPGFQSRPGRSSEHLPGVDTLKRSREHVVTPTSSAIPKMNSPTSFEDVRTNQRVVLLVADGVE